MEISIIIPAYNEEKRILPTLEKVYNYFSRVQNMDFEIIVVDDGSKDNTEKVVRNFAKDKSERVKFIKHNVNKGKGATVKTGMMEAKGEYILFSDADLSTPIEEFEKFYDYAKKNFDVITGTRRVKKAKIIKRQPFLRRFFGTGFIYLVKILFPSLSNITDFTCGFKLFKGKSAKRIFRLQKINRWGFDVEILLISKILKLKIVQVPIVWKDLRRSKVNLKKDIIRSFSDLIKIKKMEIMGYYKNG